MTSGGQEFLPGTCRRLTVKWEGLMKCHRYFRDSDCSYCCFSGVGLEPRTLCMPAKYSTTELYPLPFKTFHLAGVNGLLCGKPWWWLLGGKPWWWLADRTLMRRRSAATSIIYIKHHTGVQHPKHLLLPPSPEGSRLSHVCL